METTTQKPPTSPGDGRGEGSVSHRAGASTDRNEPKPPQSSREEPKTEAPGSGLLAADGSSLSIGDGERRAMEGIREFGRSAGDSWRKLSAAAEKTARKNPTGTALGALAVGLIAGATIGALLARD
jgi:hypothetical protein